MNRLEWNQTLPMRRSVNSRICLILFFILVIWLGFLRLSTSKIPRRSRIPSVNRLAYENALNRSMPIIHNDQICSLDAVDLVFVIISQSSNFHERQAIRETWASMPDIFTVHSQRLFVIGYREENPFYNDLLNEAEHEHDLLYLTVDDNLTTLKEIHAYRWVENYCGYVQFTFKSEDDLFVNSILLHETIRELKSNPRNSRDRFLYNVQLDSLFNARNDPETRRFLFGWAFQAGPPERNLTISPYYVTHEEFPNEFYPRYCSGFGYLMDSKTRNLLTAEALKEKTPFRFSDIFLTGILPERLNFTCDILPFTYLQSTIDDCLTSITKSNMKDSPKDSPSPVIVCTTTRHTGGTDFQEYHKIWSTLKQIYSDRLQFNEHG